LKNLLRKQGGLESVPKKAQHWPVMVVTICFRAVCVWKVCCPDPDRVSGQIQTFRSSPPQVSANFSEALPRKLSGFCYFLIKQKVGKEILLK
jgi:hypothetical protein